MKKSILSMLICAAVTCAAYAQTGTALQHVHQAQEVQEGVSYDAIVVKLKPGKSQTYPLKLDDPALVATRMYHADNLSRERAAEIAELNARYGFDRYLRIELPENKKQDRNYIEHVIITIQQNQDVETVYPEAMPVGFQAEKQEAGQSSTLLKSTVNSSLSAVSVPDYRQQQDYLKAPDDKRSGFYIGGVNRDSVNQYIGNEGENITIVSSENCGWNANHVNLPPASFVQGPNKDTCNEREHNTASVGILAARDIGSGVRGLSYKSKVGYAAWPASNLFNVIPLLKAGDVVSLNMQTYGGEITGTCKSACYIPIEYLDSYFNVIKALTDKGVFVITSAGNGNINLDSPAFNGRWDTQVRDSGAIIAGAFCSKDGKKANFSTYGSRVTSSSRGCSDVTTTGYGNLYNRTNANYTGSFGGTSSATPIVAGVVASLSGIAKANGITVTPRQMRQILAETGTPIANGDSAKVGTQPDMARAVARILALKNGSDIPAIPAPTAAAGADYTMVSPTTGVSTYPLDGSKSLNAISYNWSVTKGVGTFFLEEKLNGVQVNSIDNAHAYAVIPANTEGQATFTLTTTGADGRTAQDSMTIMVSKPATPAKEDTPTKDDTPAKDDAPANDDVPATNTAPAYNGKIAYPTKCTKVSYNGKIWFNQWYVNPGQETPGAGGQWGAWRQQGTSNNSCK
ncbi:S8 family serine peptidase [Citrobacter sedlakii]|uniref:S8 family serine peptidase n=1 Tax=Citrobacter sedlakii TaxID=67826 RepID=UPI00313A4C6C